MPLRPITRPAALPISRDEVKAQLRIDVADEDPLLERLIRTAVQSLDGPRSTLGRALITQAWELDLPMFPCDGRIQIPLPPLLSVDSITWRDVGGAPQVLDPSQYEVYQNGEQPAEIWEVWDADWPLSRAHPQAVTVRFTAGYGSAPEDIPEPLRHALLLLIGHLYENREATAPGSGPVPVPLAFQHLLDPFRILTLA